MLTTIVSPWSRLSTSPEKPAEACRKQDYVWLIDPIDGTSNFWRGLLMRLWHCNVSPV